ncbi:unnamed protein product [Amoebophrya sp. A25]|nr:unnamed protein product [Amoebophrya sp. A25]|eukprot:GSA25T00001552001.1
MPSFARPLMAVYADKKGAWLPTKHLEDSEEQGIMLRNFASEDPLDNYHGVAMKQNGMRECRSLPLRVMSYLIRQLTSIFGTRGAQAAFVFLLIGTACILTAVITSLGSFLHVQPMVETSNGKNSAKTRYYNGYSNAFLQTMEATQVTQKENKHALASEVDPLVGSSEELGDLEQGSSAVVDQEEDHTVRFADTGISSEELESMQVAGEASGIPLTPGRIYATTPMQVLTGGSGGLQPPQDGLSASLFDDDGNSDFPFTQESDTVATDADDHDIDGALIVVSQDPVLAPAPQQGLLDFIIHQFEAMSHVLNGGEVPVQKVVVGPDGDLVPLGPHFAAVAPHDTDALVGDETAEVESEMGHHDDESETDEDEGETRLCPEATNKKADEDTDSEGHHQHGHEHEDDDETHVEMNETQLGTLVGVAILLCFAFSCCCIAGIGFVLFQLYLASKSPPSGSSNADAMRRVPGVISGNGAVSTGGDPASAASGESGLSVANENDADSSETSELLMDDFAAAKEQDDADQVEEEKREGRASVRESAKNDDSHHGVRKARPSASRAGGSAARGSAMRASGGKRGSGYKSGSLSLGEARGSVAVPFGASDAEN